MSRPLSGNEIEMIIKKAEIKAKYSLSDKRPEIVGQVTAALVTEAFRNPEVKRVLLED